MAPLTTPVGVPPFPWKTDYSASHLFVGSCFTENIGIRLEELKFNTLINPYGILYNPLSIAAALEGLIEATPFQSGDLFLHGGLWHSFSHHGRYSGVDRDETLSTINSNLEAGSLFLKKADFLLLTLGTAWVYELKSTGKVVANCHKVPANEFRRYRLTVGDTVLQLRETLEKLWDFNPGIKVILTVSPVRHMKDGAAGNQLSKAVLLLAADTLVSGFGTGRCGYFPSYEIMMDELRDYRFYADDLLHPSPLAIDCIWEKFRDAFFPEEVAVVSREIAMIRKSVNHRPLFRGSQEYRQFLDHALQKTIKLAKNLPALDFSTEIEYFSKQLSNNGQP